MSDTDRILDLIEEGIVKHGGDLGGWTRRTGDGLQLFDGRVTLRALLKEIAPSGSASTVHAHVLTALPAYDNEVLDACLVGMEKDRETSLAQIAALWVFAVAGPIKSLIDSKPVHMACQADVPNGDIAKGYSPYDFGLAGMHAYVGPTISRWKDDQRIPPVINDEQPWFRFAAESAGPRRVHLAKATVASKGKHGWRWELEIDGHESSCHDSDWLTGVPGPDFGYVTRFAVFEFPHDSRAVSERAELDRAIRYFAENFSRCGSVKQLMQSMESQGFDPDLVHEVGSISTIAFGRVLFEPHGVKYSPTIVRVRGDGRVDADVPLMSIPAYSRARALAGELRRTMPKESFRSLCLYHAESNAIQKALNAEGGTEILLSEMKFPPLVVPDRDISDQTVTAAMDRLNNSVGSDRSSKDRPWWKFW
jgi:hypothetical protein